VKLIAIVCEFYRDEHVAPTGKSPRGAPPTFIFNTEALNELF